MNPKPFQVAVVGCGLIGERRARCVEAHPDTQLCLLVDSNQDRLDALQRDYPCKTSTDWKVILKNPNIDLVIVSTPNKWLAEIGIAALTSGTHVLIEKPMGRNLTEARTLADAALTHKKQLKIGFNHRYHPALQQAKRLFDQGAIGTLINLRAIYGHGGRPGYEKEWRGDPHLAGGGELTDQGVHICDLIQWFTGLPEQAFAYLQTACWPISPLEDNAFGLFRYTSGCIASMHTSWTQWKNRFNFELYGEKGALIIEGLGNSYGDEHLIQHTRNLTGGAPDQKVYHYTNPNCSWELEWEDFVTALKSGGAFLGNIEDGLNTMRMIDALYTSSHTQQMVSIPQHEHAYE